MVQIREGFQVIPSISVGQSYGNVDNQFNGNTFVFDRQVVQPSLTQAFY